MRSKRKVHNGSRSIGSKSRSSRVLSNRKRTPQTRHRDNLTAAEMALDDEDVEDDVDEDDRHPDENNETESIMDRLARQISPEEEDPGSPPPPTGTNNRRALRSSNAQTEEEAAKTVLPTIHNYKQLVDDWPPARIAVQERLQKRKGTAVPPKILTEARALQKLYKQHKSLLAIMGNVSIFTMNKALGELGGRQRPSGYQIWLKFGKEIENYRKKMPRKWGQKGILASRNKILGHIWTGLPASHREVFSPPVFHVLSGLSYSQHGKRLQLDEEQQEEEIVLEPGEREALQRLYDQIVWKEKVAKEYSKASKGIPAGPTLPDYNPCSNHSSTEVDSSSQGWCEQYTSLDDMGKYVNKKSSFATLFAARAQGLSAGEVVADTIGGNGTMTEKARKTDPGDKVKADLALELRTRMKALLGYEVGFPRGPDPEAILLDKGYDIKIIQLPGSKLPYQTLKLGFNAMNSRRSLWLDDIKANLFNLEKIASPDVQNDDIVQMDIDEEVTNTQGVTLDDEVDDDEEWGGLGDEE
ncbi:uncharacterized protein MELLADRAFT_88519 [Melampsora larici-populina 98AG31]|uniref:Uncharacterized protein n=1 Tax=Melampsora larici-populina (strain 98AG31 / pathotype 3-4-7) TaxID=747676 RepID=F4RS10_MELLP|nr:uncharacterized protein MELLADRAFT_88519 [Melampsora larici-populina 98AG31]EGG04774.1 hypothetical protein MELLADRAFT_88519 [Melampsora larici-populina 98AG31]